MSALDPAHRRDELNRLVREGLFEQNLQRIAEHAESLLRENPTVFYAIGTTARAMADEFGPQGVDEARYEEVRAALQPQMLDLLEAERGGSVERIQRTLEVFLLAYDDVYTPPR